MVRVDCCSSHGSYASHCGTTGYGGWSKGRTVFGLIIVILLNPVIVGFFILLLLNCFTLTNALSLFYSTTISIYRGILEVIFSLLALPCVITLAKQSSGYQSGFPRARFVMVDDLVLSCTFLVCVCLLHVLVSIRVMIITGLGLSVN